jgi:hypothetical protein
VNSFVELFLRAGGFIRYQDVLSVRLAIYEAPGVDLRTHNHPKSNKVAAILLADTMEAERDIILHQQVGRLQRISDTHPAYDPVYFPLLYPHGALGWRLAVRYQGDPTSHSNRVSCREFGAYRLHIKASGYSLLNILLRFVLGVVSTVASEMRVPKLPGLPDTSRLVVW